MSPTQSRRTGVILACCAAFAMLVTIAMAFPSMHRAGALACGMTALGIWLGGAALLVRLRVLRSRTNTFCAMVGLFLCLMLRLCLFDYISPDYVSFLGPWTEAMRGMTVRQVLTTPIGDYNMPYLYLLLVISRLRIYDLYCIKLVSVLADVFLALAVGKLAGLVTRRDGLVLAAFFASLLAPTVFLNSAYWGQCDGIYACFALWGLYFGLKRRPVLSMGMLACAFAFKLQAVFLLPIAAFLLVKEYLAPKHLAVFPATFLVIMLPALLAGRSFTDTFGIYWNQVGAYPYLSLNAPSFWSLIPNDFFANLDPAPVVLAGIVTLLLLYGFLLRADRLRPGDLLDLSLIFCLAIPWLLPKMHERYFYLAEVLSILYAVRHPRRLPAALIQLGGGFLIYCSYLFGGMRILSNELVAAVYGLLLCYMTLTLFRQMDRRTPYTHPSKEEPHHEEQTGISVE